MTAKFPIELRHLLDQAICNLWDKNYPRPDLTSVCDWLERDGWDYVLGGFFSSYIYIKNANDYFFDGMLIENDYVVDEADVTDEIRLAFARQKINYLISESGDSLHVIELESEKMPPAVLCILMSYNLQDGDDFTSIDVDFSVEDYLESIRDDVILGQEYLSDQQILQTWLKQS